MEVSGAAFFPPCRDSRDGCFGMVTYRGSRKCNVLTETYPVGRKCPFYKPKVGGQANENDEGEAHNT